MSAILKGRRQRGIGWNHSAETRAKMRQAWTPENRRAAKERGDQFALDPNWRKKIAESVSGSKNPRYQDGHALSPYGPGWGRVNRRIARQRANDRCEICGAMGRLDTHHKDGSKDNHAMDNLQVLCRKCHKKVHA